VVLPQEIIMGMNESPRHISDVAAWLFLYEWHCVLMNGRSLCCSSDGRAW
jgi:hypothetical protein